jgi:hypothetical protein
MNKMILYNKQILVVYHNMISKKIPILIFQKYANKSEIGYLKT